MAIKAEDGCACPLICWTHCSPYPCFILLLCCVLCKRNWKNQVWLRALWGSKLLKRREEKKGETLLSAALLSRTALAEAAPQHALCACTPQAGSRGGWLMKHLGLALSWPWCRLRWSHCPPTSPCPWLRWELALGTAAQPETHCCKATGLGSCLSAEGFPWRFEITYSPHRPPSLQLPSNESVSHLKCIFHNCSEVLEERKLTALNSSSVLSSLWPLLVFLNEDD